MAAFDIGSEVFSFPDPSLVSNSGVLVFQSYIKKTIGGLGNIKNQVIAFFMPVRDGLCDFSFWEVF